jgi:hypothetical protein
MILHDGASKRCRARRPAAILLVFMLLAGTLTLLFASGCSGPPYKWVVDAGPTVFFEQDAGRLYQLADAKIDYWLTDPKEFHGLVEVEDLATRSVTQTDVGQVAYGENVHRVKVPDISSPTRFAFRLYDVSAGTPGEFENQVEKDWAPQRKWTVSLIPSSHIDIYSTANADITPEQHRKILDTACDLCEQYPEYTFQLENRLPICEYMDGHRTPEQVSRLVDLIKRGRIDYGAQFSGVHQFTTSGESYAQGQMVPWNEGVDLGRDFGTKPEFCCVYDTPGMMKQVPEFLAKDGVKYLIHGPNTSYHIQEMMGVPYLFYWKTESGARVLTWRTSFGYNQEKENYFKLTSPDPAERERSVNEKLIQRQESRDENGNVNPDLSYPFDRTAILWDYGDNEPADAGPVNFARDWNSRFAYPRFQIQSYAGFLGGMEESCGARIPERQGELGNAWEFVVMNQGIINLYDRYCQRFIPGAQTLWTMAGLLGAGGYPAEDFRSAWDNVAKTEAHDFFYGATIDPNTGGLVPDFMNPDWAKAEWSLMAERTARNAYVAGGSALASKINTAGKQKITVFNALSYARTGPVTVQAPTALEDDHFVLRDDSTGREVPHQLIDSSVYQDCFGRRGSMKNQDGHFGGAYPDPPSPSGKFILFIADGVPSMGYRTFTIMPRASAPAYQGGPAVGGDYIENEFYRVGFEGASGVVSSIADKGLGRELVDANAQVTGKKVYFNQFLKGFTALDAIPILINLGFISNNRPFWQPILDGIAKNGLKFWDPEFAGSLQVAASGPVMSAVVATGKDALGGNRRQTVVLYRGLKRVDFVNWVQSAGSLPFERYVLSYPLAFSGAFSVSYQNAYSVARVGADELPGGPAPERHLGDWIQFDGTDRSVSIASPDVGPFSLGRVDLNVVDDARYRVPDKPYYFPIWLDTSTWSMFVVPGSYSMRFSLTSAAPGGDPSRSDHFGSAYSLPLDARVIKTSAGPLTGVAGSIVSVDRSNVDVGVIKRADRGVAVVLRLVETTGAQARATITLASYVKFKKAYLAGFDEEPIAPLARSGNRVFVDLKPHEVITVRLDP